MNEALSRIVADLFVKTKGGEELSSKIRRLRGEIKKVIESEDSIFGKFCGLLDSLSVIIPEERQRYNAAIKALSTTLKLSQQEIVKAVNNQLDELKILEKGLMPDFPGWRDRLKDMEAKSKEIRGEISKLREKIAQLESEERGILKGMAEKEEEVGLVEKAMKELFTDIGTEITSIKKKVGEFTAESAAVQPAPRREPVQIDIPGEERAGGEQKIEFQEPSAPQAAERKKTCPMCGGRMSFHLEREKWICYSCVYEESARDTVQVKREEKIEFEEPSAPQDTKWQKKCPMCGGRMNFHENDKMWICYSCAHEESSTDEVLDEREEKGEPLSASGPAPASGPMSEESSPPPVVPLEAMAFNEYHGSKKKSSSSKHQPSTKTKTCPVCRKKMNWHQMEKAWRCPHCDYERRI